MNVKRPWAMWAAAGFALAALTGCGRSVAMVSEPEPNFTDALIALSRADFRGMTKASPTLSFGLIVALVTFAFLAVYAAW